MHIYCYFIIKLIQINKIIDICVKKPNMVILSTILWPFYRLCIFDVCYTVHVICMLYACNIQILDKNKYAHNLPFEVSSLFTFEDIMSYNLVITCYVQSKLVLVIWIIPVGSWNVNASLWLSPRLIPLTLAFWAYCKHTVGLKRSSQESMRWA